MGDPGRGSLDSNPTYRNKNSQTAQPSARTSARPLVRGSSTPPRRCRTRRLRTSRRCTPSPACRRRSYPRCSRAAPSPDLARPRRTSAPSHPRLPPRLRRCCRTACSRGGASRPQSHLRRDQTDHRTRRRSRAWRHMRRPRAPQPWPCPRSQRSCRAARVGPSAAAFRLRRFLLRRPRNGRT